ncbi:MAG: hypothetical protein IRZ33_11140 [Alicyclobacillaceae bacterium]|nr:hypothetical protein [Alicyclobacillaceae bacterium]
MSIEAVMQEARQHLSMMMAKEKRNGEFLLASVVQDSLIYQLQHHAHSPNLMNIAHRAARVAVESAAEHLHPHEFTIRESVRGVVHSMVNLGGDPAAIAVAVTTGGIAGLAEVAQTEDGFKEAVVEGVCDAASDLGLDPERVRQIARHVADNWVPWDETATATHS